jgi:GNAT superfamily N-acetyltransferase
MNIRQAQPQEAALVADVLLSAAAKIRARGEIIWDPPEVSEAAVEGDVRAGRFYIAFDDEGPVGVFRFDLEDRYFWPEIPEGSSAFVHKIAVYPQKQGSGVAHVLLDRARELARQRGCQYLRLDCVSGKPGLRAVYEGFGFRHHSEKKIGDMVFDRFELAIGPAVG